nr:hypothetical protein [uncultured bacterium]AMP48423.1 hypothetical protein [uncultured bacterium]
MYYVDWNIFTQVFVLLGYTAAIIYIGYIYGRDDAEWEAEEKANLTRAKIAREQQLYDWEKHGL